MTDQELKDLVASLAVSQKETDRQLKETDRQLTKQIKELGKQIGGLGNKFGSFTEGLAFPAMERILRKHFGMDTIAPRVKKQKDNQELELDVLAYANGDKNEVYIVEIKSHLQNRELQQVLKTMEDFPKFFTEFKDKKLYGIVAAIDISKEMKQKVLEAGLYLALIQDTQFNLQTPKNFQPRCFN
ncbi:MAG: hypothetical protein RIT27_1694 [Pseudomonadota bacterium]|jgi:hypothetical protein